MRARFLASEWCAYSTVRLVRIHDPKLAVLHYAFQLCVLAYVLAVPLWLNKGYLVTDAPTGAVRMNLLKPCAPPFEECHSQWQQHATPASELAYCVVPDAEAQDERGPRLPCLYLDQFDAVWPPSVGASAFVTTRVSETNQSRHCSVRDYACEFTPRTSSSPANSYFVADVDAFTLRVDHAVRSASLGLRTVSAQRLRGDVVRCVSGTACSPVSPSHWEVVHEFVPGEPDILPLGSLLATASVGDEVGASLDDAAADDDSGASLRHEGVVLMLSVQYDNTGTLIPGSGPRHTLFGDPNDNIRYRWRLRLLPELRFKVEEAAGAGAAAGAFPSLGAAGAALRVVRSRHGVLIVVVQTGTLGAFSFSALLLQLTTSLTLLALATFVVDTIACYVLRERRRYRGAKYLVARGGGHAGCAGGGASGTTQLADDGARGRAARSAEQHHSALLQQADNYAEYIGYGSADDGGGPLPAIVISNSTLAAAESWTQFPEVEHSPGPWSPPRDSLLDVLEPGRGAAAGGTAATGAAAAGTSSAAPHLGHLSSSHPQQ